MASDFKFYRDEHGMLSASMPPKYEYLGEYLISDIQGSRDHAREVLDEVLNVKTGAKEKWEQDGNAYALTVTKGTALIEGQWEEGIHVEVPIDDFVRAVSDWLKFLESPEYRARRGKGDGFA